MLAAVRRGRPQAPTGPRRPGPSERAPRRPDRRPALRGRQAGPALDVGNDGRFAFSIGLRRRARRGRRHALRPVLSGFDTAGRFWRRTPRRNRCQTKLSERQAFRAAGRPRNQRRLPPARTRRIRDEHRLPNRKTSAQPTEAAAPAQQAQPRSMQLVVRVESGDRPRSRL